MKKHCYNGWTFFKVAGRYIIERDSDLHVAPMNCTSIQEVKIAIDSGKAAMTSTEYKARLYVSELYSVEVLRKRAFLLSDKAAERALEILGEK